MNEAELLDRLRASGLRVTPQRRAVATAFAAEGSIHLTADTVLERARTIVPEISRATVYNSLNELVERGVLRTVSVGGGPVRFDPNTDAPHHFVCMACGRIEDVEPSGLGAIELAGDLEVERVELVFRGRCAACRNRPRP
jgi:Fur family ferric uptake transcriptional regulator